MSEVDGVAGQRLRLFVERIKQAKEELKGLSEAKKEIFDEVGQGGTT
jgi:uncharacterized protein (UPF0335 family)